MKRRLLLAALLLTGAAFGAVDRAAQRVIYGDRTEQ